MIENQHISEMSFLFYEEGNRNFSQYFGASDEQVMNKFIVDNWNTPYKFSGKELDDETGYSYFGARYYDPNISIWLSVDPLSDKYPGQTPYNYTLNNPVKYTDPNGEFPILGTLVGAAAGAIGEITSQTISYGLNCLSPLIHWTKFDNSVLDSKFRVL